MTRDWQRTEVVLPRESTIPDQKNYTKLAQLGHLGRGALRALAFLPDGRLASGGGYGVALHNPETLVITQRFSGLSVYRIVPMKTSPTLLLFAHLRGSACIVRLELSSGEWRELLSDLGNAPMIGMGLSPDEQTLYLAGEGGGVRVYHLDSGKEALWRSPLERKGSLWETLSVSRDGSRIAVFVQHSWDDHNLLIWSREGVLLAKHNRSSHTITIAPDGRILEPSTHAIVAFDPSTQEVTRSQGGTYGNYGMCAIAVTPDGTRVVAGGYWGEARIHALPGLELLGETPHMGNESWTGDSHDVMCCNDTYFALSAPRHGRLSVYKLAAPAEPIAVQHGYNWGIRSFSATDALDAIAYYTAGRRCLWELEVTRAAIKEHSFQPEEHSISISGRGAWRLIAGGWGVQAKKIKLYQNNTEVEEIKSRVGLRLLRWSEDGTHFLVLHGANDEYPLKGKGELELRRAGQAKVVKRFSLSHTPWDAELSPDNQRLALIEGARAVLYEAPKWKELASVDLPRECSAVALHPTAPRFAASSYYATKQEHTLWLIDAGADLPARQLVRQEQVTALCFSADGAALRGR